MTKGKRLVRTTILFICHPERRCFSYCHPERIRQLADEGSVWKLCKEPGRKPDAMPRAFARAPTRKNKKPLLIFRRGQGGLNYQTPMQVVRRYGLENGGGRADKNMARILVPPKWQTRQWRHILGCLGHRLQEVVLLYWKSTRLPSFFF